MLSVWLHDINMDQEPPIETLFGKGLSAYPSNWRTDPGQQGEIELGSYVEVRSGPYAELRGVVTYLERGFVWARLEGDGYDLRFRRDLLEIVQSSPE